MTHQTVRFGSAACLCLAGPAALAAGTPAGTAIDNQAEISFDIGGEARRLTSNIAVFRVAEVLDVNVLLQTPELLVDSGASAQSLLFTITNTGNGPEAFSFAPNGNLTGDQFDPVLVNPTLFFDSDANGRFSSGDTAYVSGSNEPVLDADQSIDVLLVGDIPAGLADGALGLADLSAAAVTGSGTPGQTFAAAGTAGVDAVVGASGASRTSVGRYLVAEIGLSVQKSALVSDPAGGTEAVPGAAIRYTVQVVPEGRGTAAAATFSDPIPANTTYVPGSLRLNGLALTDAADGDAGVHSISADEIAVQLGDLAAGTRAQQIQFTVTFD